MIIDLGSLTRARVPGPVYDPQALPYTASLARKHAPGQRRFKLRHFLTVWAVASVIWMAGAVYDIYQRVDEQADMSVDVERDLDQGLSNASCTGTCLAAAQESPAVNRLDIASTYLQFGSVQMGECVAGPPAALLLIGLGAFSVSRRRRRRA